MLAAAALAAALATLGPARTRAVEPEATHMTPPPQPPLEVLHGKDAEPVRQRFNQFADRTRIVTLLSPT